MAVNTKVGAKRSTQKNKIFQISKPSLSLAHSRTVLAKSFNVHQPVDIMAFPGMRACTETPLKRGIIAVVLKLVLMRVAQHAVNHSVFRVRSSLTFDILCIRRPGGMGAVAPAHVYSAKFVNNDEYPVQVRGGA